MKYSLLIVFFSFICISSYSQTRPRETSRENYDRELDRGATYSVEKKKTSKKKVKRSLSKSFDRKVEEYEERMQTNAKKYAKMEKEMRKPQYSDPAYFGHKKKPKKRPPGKKKFCKECQMIH